MSWVKIDERLSEHPKIVGLSDRAFRVHINALCYCNRNLTDGRIPGGALRSLMGNERLAGQLVSAGLWEQNGTGWLVHDYLDFNFSREQVERRREERRKAGEKGAQVRWQTT